MTALPPAAPAVPPVAPAAPAIPAKCVAITKKGARCKFTGSCFENLCSKHFDAKQRSDPEFRERFRVHREAQEVEQRALTERLRADFLNRERILQQEAEARRIAEAARAVALRAEQTAKRDAAIANAHTMSVYEILRLSKRIGTMWSTLNIPGWDIVKAYYALYYMSPALPGFPALIRAAVKFRYLGTGNHPDHATFAEVPQAEKDAVYEEIRTALLAYGETINLTQIPVTDTLTPAIQRRQADERIAERARRIAEFEARDRAAPVVFQRDPEGGVNLRAFATDTQNIHRSSVQDATHKVVIAIMTRPAPSPEDQNTLEEIVAIFSHIGAVKWANDRSRQIAITEVTKDYHITEAFSVRYAAVLDRVWSFIRVHDSSKDLTQRLAEEICEGYQMCSNGKMARLVNVLRGFDETLEAEAPREVFQFRMAALRKVSKDKREAAAKELFTEFKIPEAEHEVWLDALMDDDDVPTGAAGAASQPLVAVGGAGLA